jgi:aromatic-L-amino-acid/L-tryptophan decarboxylase
MIARHNALARHLETLVDAAPDLERAAPVELSIVCFRYVPPGMKLSEEELDALNKAIMEEVQAGGEAFITQAVLHDRFVLRASVMHYATTPDDVEALVDIVRGSGARLATSSQ